METLDLDGLRLSLRNYLVGNAGGNADRMLALVGRKWRLAAQIEQLTRQTSLLRVLDDQVLAAVAAGQLDVSTEAHFVARGLTEVTRPPARMALIGCGRSLIDAPPEILIVMYEAITEIAGRRLGIADLSPGSADALTLTAEALVEILADAFVTGWHSAA